MSKEQKFSPPPSPPVKSSSKLPPLPDDFLSFQPQPSYNRSEDVDIATNSLDIKQEHQQHYGDNLAGGGGDDDDYNQYGGTYGTPGSLKSGHKRGGRNNYTNTSNNYTPRGNNYANNYSSRGNNYANNYTSRGNNYVKNYTSRGNTKKQRFNKNRFNDAEDKDKTSDDISLYYKKSFLDDPWAVLFDKEFLKSQK